MTVSKDAPASSNTARRFRKTCGGSVPQRHQEQFHLPGLEGFDQNYKTFD